MEDPNDWRRNKLWEIDVSRKNERTKKDMGFEFWNWIFNPDDQFWYPKLSSGAADKKMRRLKNKEKYGCVDPFSLLFPDDETFKCDLCGFCAKNEITILNHMNNRGCKTRRERNKCIEANTTFELESEKKVSCTVCNKEFANKYVYQKHCRTSKAHQLKKYGSEIPTQCVCGKELSQKAKFVRHLRTSKKCKKICAADPKKMQGWNELYKIFSCKF
jgi:hypothetical protein